MSEWGIQNVRSSLPRIKTDLIDIVNASIENKLKSSKFLGAKNA